MRSWWFLLVVACSHPAPPPTPVGASNTPVPAPQTHDTTPVAMPNEAGVTLTTIDPATGDPDGNTYVRLAGTGFAKQPREAKISFGGIAGTIVRIASDREIIAEAPGGPPGKTVDVVLELTPGGTFTLPLGFRYAQKK